MKALLCCLLLGCASAKPVEAETTYLGQQLQCVDRFDTKTQIDECRNAVKARWANDAGKDGAP